MKKARPFLPLPRPPEAYIGWIKTRSVETGIFMCNNKRQNFEYSVAVKTRRYQGPSDIVQVTWRNLSDLAGG